jgi:hypothetical protein
LPWEEKWESLKVNESNMAEQELDDEDRQARFWRRLAEDQHLAVTQDLQKLFKDTELTVEQLSFVVGHKSVSASICHDLLFKFSIRKEDSLRVKVIKNLGRTLLDELENLFRSYWDHRLGVSDGLFQVLGQPCTSRRRVCILTISL